MKNRLSLIMTLLSLSAQSWAQAELSSNEKFLQTLNQVLSASQTIHWAYEGTMKIDSAFAIDKNGVLSVTVHYNDGDSYARLRQTVPLNKVEAVTQDRFVIFKCADSASLAFRTDEMNGREEFLGGDDLFFIGEYNEDESVLEQIQDLLESVQGNPGLVFYEDARKWGFKNAATGDVVIPARWENVLPFSERRAAVMSGDSAYGFIDTKGTVIAELQYNGVRSFHEGRAAVNLGGVPGFVGEGYPEVNTDTRPKVEAFDIINGQWGFIDKQGHEVVPIKYDQVKPFFEGFAAVQSNGKWGFVDKSGQEVIAIQYDNALPFSEGLAAVKSGKKWIYIDQKGVNQKLGSFEECSFFSEGLAPVKTGGKWGFIDKSGKKIIPNKYSRVSLFSQGKAAVSIDGPTNYIDKHGNEVH